ncbi:hypothetical protein F4693_002152 [Sphingomonas endophytica]|uniref:Uncharacterized protein n=1 Tax=Sphingomonas endophytica TaxID=869719 RepID=A0A7X0JCL5_9SPHN|nr:hypothetical protein [Sphingomonas endophytica]MBB6505165.1 hypothetical protein [Sphingomonas endophytica]
MRFDRTERIAASGVPLVFDRFGLIGPFVAEVVDPLSTARGLLTGLMLAALLWTMIAALVI